MFTQKEKKASMPAIVLKNMDFPQVIAEALPVKLPEFPVVRKSDEKKPDIITRALEYEHTPIIAAAAVGFLAGVVVGFMVSPVREGINLFSNNDLHTEECVCEEEDED